MNIVAVILLVYFAVMVSIGIYSWFTISNAQDYYVSGKRGNWWQISGSLFATIIGGSAIMGTIELSQKAGWAAIWFLGSAAAGLFVLVFISGKVSRLGHYTLPEMVRLFYGAKAERTASLLIPLAWLGIVAVQIVAGAKILASLGLMSYSRGTLLCGLVFVFYTLVGGQKSILKTDFLQALIILGGLITVFVLKLKNIDVQSIPPLTAESLFNENFSAVDLFFLMVTYSATFVVGPDIYSRIFCAKDEQTARKSVLLVALLIIPVSMLLTFLGVTAGYGDVAVPGEILILPGTGFLPPWALGLLAAALLSAVMSSADTTLLTSAMILSGLVTGNLDKKSSFVITRLFIVVIGCISILIALKVTSILQALSLSLFSGAFILPVIAGIAGWKVNQKMAYVAMITGGFTALAGKIIDVYYAGNLGNLIILLAFILNGFILMFSRRKKTAG